jgi:hypothetical protein
MVVFLVCRKRPNVDMAHCFSPLIGLQRLLRIAAALIILGLLTVIVSLGWIHPLAFVLFAFIGASLIALGFLVYLESLVFAVSPPGENRG